MHDLDALKKEVRACRLCEPQLPLGARPIIQLSRQSRILIVGQAPGTKVHETGIAFNDPSGHRLREWLRVDNSIFYDERKFALLPMGFCYPGKGKSGDLPPRPECAEIWREKLLLSMQQVRLTIVLGRYAATFHLPETRSKNLTEIVRNWRQYWPSVLPMPHPSPRNNLWLRRNPWLENEIVPELRIRVKEILKH